MYQSRTSATIINVEPDNVEYSITISTAESSDNGSYEVSGMFSSYSKCFSVYILGPPTSEITVTPAEIDEGNGVTVTCSANSTTIPGTHNLTMHILWYTDGQIITTGGIFRVNANELIISVVTKADINLVITCEAKEERGLTTSTNTTLPVYWGPDSGPELQPSNTFYHFKLGVRLPNINCRVDCHPPCDIRWYKLGSQEVLSFNGTLSLGELDRNSTGEYTCRATYLRTTVNRSISLFILMKEDRVPRPELHPPNTFYHTKSGIQLPNIHCSVNCHQTCDLRWYKIGSPAVLSFNGTLSLGVLDRNSSGEYICMAINSGTTEKSSISFYVLIQEDQVLRPELHPPDTFYHTKSGIQLPDIHCSVNCNPTCDLRWYKIGNPAVLSFNETLSLGVLDRNSSGEYICMAINSETTEKSSISFHVLIQEDQVPRPELHPPNTFYHTKSGIQLPNIHCSVNCHPTCDLRWYKIGSPAVLSFNGSLSLGVLDRNSSGEYVCMAINSETTEKSSISFYVLIQEDQEHTHTNTTAASESSEFKQNYTPLGAVGGALGAALLLALICIVCLLIRGNTSKLCNPVSFSSHKDDPVEMSSQNPGYGNLPVTERTSQQYAEINTDLSRAVIKESGTSKAPRA